MNSKLLQWEAWEQTNGRRIQSIMLTFKERAGQISGSRKPIKQIHTRGLWKNEPFALFSHTAFSKQGDLDIRLQFSRWDPENTQNCNCTPDVFESGLSGILDYS